MNSAINVVARPYAKAAFEYASAGKALAEWSGMLQMAAAIVSDQDMAELLTDPRVDKRHLADVVIAVSGTLLNQAGRNFICLLAENSRLAALPAITELYESMRSEAEHKITVRVVSAFPLEDTEKMQLSQVLEKRLSRHVLLQCSVNEHLLGGAVIYAGDKVIDGSIRGKLVKLAAALKHA